MPFGWETGKQIGCELTGLYKEIAFQSFKINDEIYSRIKGISYKEGESIPIDRLRYLTIPHRDYSDEVILGELICNAEIAEDLTDIFRHLFETAYPIGRMRLIDCYGGDDELSMRDNNTSCFNHRQVPWGTQLSKHAIGMAIDINPKYNPLVRVRNGVMKASPQGSLPFADRSLAFDYKIRHGDPCHAAFIQHGFHWGGDWKSSKDYQHFER